MKGPRIFHLTLPVKPTAWSRPRIDFRGAKARGYVDKRTSQAKEQLRNFWISIRPPITPSFGPLALRVEFRIRRPKTVKRDFPDVRPDIDNLTKLICDSWNGLAWWDDAQIVELEARKVYAAEECVIVELWRMVIDSAKCRRENWNGTHR